MFLEWEKIYSVNVEELDNQHKNIFDIINLIYELKNEGIDKKKSKEIIANLKDYGNFHLATEEKYFKEFNYPEASTHIAQHDSYRDKILEIENKNLEDKEFFKELSNFLRIWWINHIQSVDQEYSNFFNQKGLN